jgi:DNA-binding HxlR family transcriptional regulator
MKPIIENMPDWRSSCPLSSALDIFGDKWSLLIIRDLEMYGTRTYSEFLEAAEKISTNNLASRLKVLEEFGLIEHLNPDASSRGNPYKLTESGNELVPVGFAFREWALKYLPNIHTEMSDVPIVIK